MVGIGTRVLATKDKLVSLENDIWETHEKLGSFTELENEECDCSMEEQVSKDLRDGSLSERSAETEATATAAAATIGL